MGLDNVQPCKSKSITGGGGGLSIYSSSPFWCIYSLFPVHVCEKGVVSQFHVTDTCHHALPTIMDSSRTIS